MKLLRYFLPVLLAVFTFCACDDWFGGDDPSDKEPQFSDYFKMEITRCERVADVLIVDFKMKNVSGKDLQQVELRSHDSSSKDNLGNDYYNRQDVSLGGKWSGSGQKSIKKNETITGSFRIRGFDKTNSAQKLTLNFRCASSDLNFNSEVSIANIKIADKRVLTDGIDTNDFGLKYQLVGTERGRNCSFITFTVTNNTGVNLSDVDFDTNNNYFSGDTESFRCYISSDGSAFSSITTLRIQTGETKTLTIRVNNVPDRIKQLRGAVTCRTDSYILCSEDVNFYDMTFE